MVASDAPTIKSSTEVTLSGSFSGATSVPSEVGFYWGTSSSSLTNHSVASSPSSKSGTFSVTLSGLTPGQTYVFYSYAIVSGTGSYASSSEYLYAESTMHFTMPGGVEPAVDKDWLELGSAKKGSQYVVSTTYSGERNYTVFYDTSMMTPLWTAYPLNSSHMGSLDRPSSWSYNPDIDEKYQIKVTGSSYSGNTYSRGHMCPNGSRNGNSTMQAQTFYVTNQVPQIQNNFNSGIWSSLESAVQTLGKKEEIYVVTGVAFNKEGQTSTIKYVSPSSTSSQKVPIPNYFYKLVLRVKTDSKGNVTSAKTVAYWFEHKTYSDSYDNYTVSVDQVEEWTGFDFFVNLPDDIEKQVEANTISWSTFLSF